MARFEEANIAMSDSVGASAARGQTSKDERGLDGAAVLVLSPHLDDALFSVHTFIRTAHPEVWTVFAGSPDGPGVTDWDRGCGFEDSRELMAARRQEDLAAFAHVPGATVRHLDMQERAYTTSERRAGDLARLRKELVAWADAHEGVESIVLVPVGAGTRMAPGIVDRLRALTSRLRARPERQLHPDPGPGAGEGRDESALPADLAPTPERQVQTSWLTRLGDAVTTPIRRILHADFQRRRAAAQRRGILANEDHVAVRDLAVDLFASDPRVEVWFYEELPYLWGEPGDAEARRIGAAHPLQESTWTVDVEAKASCVRTYATQLGMLDPAERALRDSSVLPAQERIWRPARHCGGSLQPGVSVVIPAHDAAQTISLQLEALAAQQDPPPFEVIVVDNRSRDDLAVALAPWRERLLSLTVLPAHRRTGASYARNVGIGAARRAYIAFCDADDVVSATWLRDLSAQLAVHRAVSGSARPLPSERFTALDDVRLWLDDEEGDPVTASPAPHGYPILMAGDCAFRTEFLRSLGGFDQSFVRGGEDNDLALRVVASGEELMQISGARVAYRDRPTMGAKVRKEWWRGAMQARLATRHRLWATSPHLGPRWFLELPKALGAAGLMAIRAKRPDWPGVSARIATATGIASGFVWHQVLGRDPGPQLGVGFDEGASHRRSAGAFEEQQ